MKKTRLLGVPIGMLISINSMAQLGDYAAMVDSLLTKPVVSGFLWWQQPNSFIPGECFQQYQIISGDTLNNSVLDKTWVDSSLEMTHYRYKQTYKDVPVEGAIIIEHFSKGGDLIYTNGKLAIEIDMRVTPQLSASTAKQMLLDSLPNGWNFAWNDSLWEEDLRIATGDSAATNNPEGELIIALDDYTDLNFYIPASRYRLAYKFDVLTINPQRYATYFVDAHTGQIFKELSQEHYDGSAIVYNSGGGGSQIIDTRYRGFPNYDYVLETNDGDMRIHTKNHSGWVPWSTRPEIDKDNEPWDYHAPFATTAHWYTQKAWDFFEEVFSRSGMNGDNARVRLHVKWATTQHVGLYDRANASNNMYFSNYAGDSPGHYMNIVAHEYTHGVTWNTAEFVYSAEPGALDESFSDIFGLLAARYTFTGSIVGTDWLWGDADLGNYHRRLDDPKADGQHSIESGGSCYLSAYQPDTYLGTNWQDTDIDCDNKGVHGNSGVQNYWFYLLAKGGSGTNDNGDSYTITGIGEDKAALIAYWNLTNNLYASSQYSDAAEGAKASALLLYGFCSNEHYQTENAWYAVGVGDESPCTEVTSLDEEINLEGFSVYPNPIEQSFRVVWEEKTNFDLNVYDTQGQLIYTQSNVTNQSVMSLPMISKGMYMVEVKSDETILRKRIIKK